MRSWAGAGRAVVRAKQTRAVLLATLGLLALAAGAQAQSLQRGQIVNAISALRHGHLYRHGVVPGRAFAAGQSAVASTLSATSSKTMTYGGGLTSGGTNLGSVTTGKPVVYLVFWGSQWGAQGTNAAGNVTLSGDPSGMAPYLEAYLKGLGTNNETWSGVMTQYCDGVATGSNSCPGSATHVGYPTGGAFAGVWVDASAAAPSQASGNQIGQEAVAAAKNFNQLNQTANRNVQYVIVSPTGTHPDGYNSGNPFVAGFCAWHDYTGDSTLSGGAVASPYGQLAFTNLPYITDMGSSCGQNFVNSSGPLDGVSIVAGHEYAETLTDQYPAGGWTVPSNGSQYSGWENGDNCAWISSGQGASQNITLATGSFAVQSTWSNSDNACMVTDPIITNGSPGANTVTVNNPGNQTSTAGSSASLQITASDSASGQTLTYSAAGLPAGLSINRSSGLINGTPTTAGSSSVTVTAQDSTGATGSTSFSWTVNAGSSGGCTPGQLLGNPGFETGTTAPWSATAGVINSSAAGEPAHAGSYLAWLDGYGRSHTDTLSQSVNLRGGCASYSFSYWLHIDTAETTTTTAYDKLTVQVLNSSGAVVATLATFSNLNKASGYQQHTSNLAAYAGQTVTLKFTGTENSSRQTSFVVDDTALNVS